MTDTKVDKQMVASQFSEPINLIHLKEYEKEFCDVFEVVMANLLK